MPPFTWPTDPIGLIQSFEKHNNPQAGALFVWAAASVESLHYLDDIDRDYDVSHTTIGGHRPDVVDVAHARWATGTCITALDLCAAGLGRAFCAHTKPHELDLANFNPSQQPSRQKKVARLAMLPQAAQQWVDAVCADSDYKEGKDARDWLVHRRMPRHFTLPTGDHPPQRLELELEVTGKRLGVRQLVEKARDVATQHVSTFLVMLPHL